MRVTGNRPRQVAVALGYEPGGPAPPQILAAGRGELAERLARLELGAHVPPELWQAVATVLAFLYRADAAAAAATGSGSR